MRLYVGNLPYDADQDELKNVFSEFGEVGEIVIPTDRETGRGRGFAFVDMESNEEAQAAIEGLAGSQMSGRAIRVNEARPPERRGDGGQRDQRW